jgi:hypothetical protein
MSNFVAATELAESIAGPAHYQFEDLVEGIRNEQQRLGAFPYVTILWQQVLDYDGLTDWLFLGESFEHCKQAHDFVVGQIAELLASHTAPGRKGCHLWRAEPNRQGVFVPRASPDFSPIKSASGL